jgi:hypothetical protein
VTKLDPEAYERVVSNKSGFMDIQDWNDGVWIVIEDNVDICSIGLSSAEIQELISYLLIRLVNNEG